jgi:predicted glycosyltransferase
MEKEHIQPARIAIYSQDGFGLGHMRRTSLIAAQIGQLRPNTSILTLSDSQLGQFFPMSHHHDYVKLPSIAKDSPGRWKATHLEMPFEEVLELRKQLIRSVLLSFAPQILLVDHMPHGAMGELVPALDALQEAQSQTQIVLGIRDILDAPEVITQRWSVEGAYETIRRYYSRVLIYGMRDVFDVASQYKFPEAIADMVRYCGYVANPQPPAGTARIRARYLAGAPANTRLVVAMAGGGADAYPLMSTLLDTVARLESVQPVVLALITGPFMPPELAADLNQRARRAPVRVIESVEDTLNYIAAADLVIAMGGYNTTMEILRVKKPAILVPRVGPSAEQRTRASLFADRRWVDMLAPEELTPEALGEKMLARLRKTFEIQPYTRPDLHGVYVAAQQILAVLDAPREPMPVGFETYQS